MGFVKRLKRKRNMCNTRQENQQQNHPWQGAYPDLSSLNELFSPQAAVNPEQSSPWIAFLASLGLQPIPGAQQEAGPAQDQPSAPPAPQTHDDQAFAGVNQSRQQPSPGSPPHPTGHSCGYSCGAPHISQLLQAITSRLIHFSSVATHASFTFFCILAFTGCMSAANHWQIPQVGEFASLGTTQLGLNTETTIIEFLLDSTLCHRSSFNP